MSESVPRWLPAPLTIHTAVVVVVLAAVSVAKGLTDPDYYWHVAAGELIATSGIPTTDPFSFTWQGQPWTPHEWLGELLLYWMASSIGPVATLATFGAIAGLSIGVAAQALTRRGPPTTAAILPASLATLVYLPYVTARPQALSWLFLAAELALLMSLSADRPRRALLLVPLFVLWANVHGLYVIGLGVGAVYLLFTLAGRTPMAAARGWLLAAAVGAGLASMATPAGPIGILYPLRYIDGSDWGLANIQEWQSPDFHDPAHLPLLGLVVALAFAAGHGPGWQRTLAIVGVIAALVALRNGPIAALLAMPVLAGAFASRLRPRRAIPARIAAARRAMELGAGVLVAVGAWLTVVPADPSSAVRAATEDGFPVEAVRRLASADPDARVVAEYGWAGYVIHELYPSGGRVFVDGRNDMYPEEILHQYSTVRAAEEGWPGILDRYDAEWLLFPPEAAIARGFASDAGWCETYRDERQVLLGRCP